MSAWQIPLSGTPAPRENPFEAVQRAQLNDTNLALGKQSVATSQQEQLLREQQIEGATLANQQSRKDMEFRQALGEILTEQHPDEPAPQPAAPGTLGAARPPAALPDTSGVTGGPFVAQPRFSNPGNLETGRFQFNAPAPSLASAAAPAPTAKPPLPAAQPTGGLAPFDYNRVAQRLAEKGFGAYVPAYLQGQTEMQTKHAQLVKDQLANGATALEQSTQLLNGATDQATYAAILPKVRSLIQQVGLPPNVLPDQYDQQSVETARNWGMKQADHLRQGYEAANMAQQLALGLPKTAEEYENRYNSDLATVQSQDQLEQKNKAWQALVARDKTGLGQSILNKIIEPTYSDDLQTKAALSSMKPEERTKYFQGRLELASQQLAAAAQQGQDAYAAELAKHPNEAALFPRADGTSFDSEAVSSQAAEVGMTGAQRVTAQNTMQYREDLLGIRQQMANIAQQRVDKGPANQKTALDQIMQRMWADTRLTMHNRGVDNPTQADVIKFIDEGNWTDNPDIEPHLMTLRGMFQRSNQADLNALGSVARREALESNQGRKDALSARHRMEWLTAHPNADVSQVPATETEYNRQLKATPKPTAPSPVAANPGPAPAPAAAKPSAPSPAPQKKAGQFVLHLSPELSQQFGGKKVLVFPDQESGKKFAEAAGLQLQ